ncbi:hypothetical protein RU97_GL000071 [Enterococcus canis]|uniref:DUF2187 domain-containing protein n=1 Tax=Enterococcus canis TaxID=214095 RepID=A0A1L8RJA5_9ENTE|nr:hypothetical protein [Enterococcus canis]OJG19838.1 hypothetical protein RU97_GL000071 [Enterococcus canis]
MEIQIGKTYFCKGVEIDKGIVGTVLQVYTNTAVVLVEEYDQGDRVPVLEKQGRAVVRLCDFLQETSIQTAS